MPSSRGTDTHIVPSHAGTTTYLLAFKVEVSFSLHSAIGSTVYCSILGLICNHRTTQQQESPQFCSFICGDSHRKYQVVNKWLGLVGSWKPCMRFCYSLWSVCKVLQLSNTKQSFNSSVIWVIVSRNHFNF